PEETNETSENVLVRKLFFEAIAKRFERGKALSALCLSGGGIRSATFNLGVIQGLARRGLLQKFDYLSSVSGGGYIASWLRTWMYRDGTDHVLAALEADPF